MKCCRRCGRPDAASAGSRSCRSRPRRPFTAERDRRRAWIWKQAIAGLPEGCRTVFVLHDVEGLRHEEIASLTGTAVGTSKAHLFRARRLLRAGARPMTCEFTRDRLDAFVAGTLEPGGARPGGRASRVVRRLHVPTWRPRSSWPRAPRRCRAKRRPTPRSGPGSKRGSSPAAAASPERAQIAGARRCAAAGHGRRMVAPRSHDSRLATRRPSRKSRELSLFPTRPKWPPFARR